MHVHKDGGSVSKPCRPCESIRNRPAPYARLRFWVDIMAWLPFDYIIVEGIWPPCYVSNTARYVSLLKLLRVVGPCLLACCLSLRPQNMPIWLAIHAYGPVCSQAC